MARTRPVRAAAIYARLSRDRSGESLGIDRQEELCRNLAADKGWEVAEVYVDRDLSAYTGKRRPGYERMLDDLKNHRRDGVIVVDQDRLTRTPRELESFIDLADSEGIALASVSGEVDLSTSDGRFRARIMGTVARQESEKKSERLKRQRDQAALLGQFQGGRRPFGYERDGTTVRKAEAKLIRDAADRVLAGESLRRIAMDWNERGIPTSSGGHWWVTSVRQVLTGPRLAGLRVHRGEVVADAAWPAILDRDTHEKIRAILGDPRRAQRGRPVVHLLAGVLRCGRCGAKMRSARRRGVDRYTCPGAPVGCGRVAIVGPQLETLVTDSVLYRIDTPQIGRTMKSADRSERQEDEPDVDVAELERELEALATDYGEGRITRREWLAARAPLERRLDDAHRIMPSTIDAHIVEPLRTRDVRGAWMRLDLDRRRAVLRALIDRVTIAPSGPGQKKFDPDRVDIVWKA
jgi:DNA invertase Pin-like site-specific DNA recombinase